MHLAASIPVITTTIGYQDSGAVRPSPDSGSITSNNTVSVKPAMVTINSKYLVGVSFYAGILETLLVSGHFSSWQNSVEISCVG